jgi:hypothetical protein
MLTAYLDETGHESDEWVFVAGFYGNDEQCRRLATEWKQVLGRRSKFHMSSLRWKHHRTKRLLSALGPIPSRCGLQRIAGGVKVSDYADLIHAGTMHEKALKGYVLCLLGMMFQVLCHLPQGERLEIVFEQQDEYEPLAHDVLSMLAKSDHPWMKMQTGEMKLAKWSFVPKQSTILTQPADYLAYALLQRHRDIDSQRAQWTESILTSGDGVTIGNVISRERIRKNIARAQLQGTAEQLDKKYGIKILRNPLV